MNTATPLSSLNFGDGVGNLSGQTDLQIMAKDGKSFEVNLDGAATIGDVIDLINAAATAATVPVEAAFATTGNGIRIEDKTGGTGTLRVALGESFDGGDRSGAASADGRRHSRRTARQRRESDTHGRDHRSVDGLGERVTRRRHAGDRVGRTTDWTGCGRRSLGFTGSSGAGAQTMTAKRQQLEDAALTTKAFLSQVQDLELAEATTRCRAR